MLQHSHCSRLQHNFLDGVLTRRRREERRSTCMSDSQCWTETLGSHHRHGALHHRPALPNLSRASQQPVGGCHISGHSAAHTTVTLPTLPILLANFRNFYQRPESDYSYCSSPFFPSLWYFVSFGELVSKFRQRYLI